MECRTTYQRRKEACRVSFVEDAEVIVVKRDLPLERKTMKGVEEAKGEGRPRVLNGSRIPADIEKLFSKWLIGAQAVGDVDAMIAFRVEDEEVCGSRLPMLA